uniref:disease resistance protein RPV1-like n=1 Tax=Erigeron canadensis TaxID=72917 RepID=UPI001CB8E952|nr:disease resistance protein RPV1-like [Erigeron canadensis]
MSELVRQGYSTYDHNHKSYDVFISFRGADTRNNFTDHLYNALVEANITTFLDEEEIETGEDLKPELVNAIKSSRVSIIVLSKNYATSTWCLDELALILHQRLISDHIVIPIFYHVEPTDVRKQQNSFGDAIASHKQRMEAETNAEKRSQWTKKMDRWIKALTQVASLKGKGVKDRREAEFIREIVANIHRIIGGHLTHTLPLLFGMEDSIDFISSWLTDGSSHTSDILTIIGMGGIGKTSLAKYVHGSYCHLFKKSSSFIESIGEKCAAHGLLVLQKQLYGDISKTSQFHVHDTSAYISMIKRAVTRKKVFLVLDNIDSVDQLHALLGEPEFYPGSKIIITTKDVSLVDQYVAINPIVQGNHKKCLIEGLHKKASSQLLSHHAFMSDRPKEGYGAVSEKVMAYCGGHPLALKVLGGSLCNKSVAEWEDCIIGLKEEPDSRIQKALQMSFDSMPSNNDKELFKHIACFFVHEDRVFAETILNSCGIRARKGISNLIDRCLLTIGPGNCLMMHQLLQEMGRDSVRQESLGKPEEHSRLWCHEESFNVLEENKGTGKIKGLVLNMKMLEMEKFRGSVKLDTYALSKMSNLMLLHLNYVQLTGSYKIFPRKLRWLCMHGFPLKSIPSDLPMENLVALDLSYSNIESFDMSDGTLQQPGKRQKVSGSCSKGKRLLRSLKFLTLSFSKQLQSLGGFLELPMLQRLIARKCIRLTEICESIENCAELDHIDLSDCHKLEKLPKPIGSLKKVETLKLDGCDLHELPIEMMDTDSLEVLEDKAIDVDSKTSSCANLEVLPSNLKLSAIFLPNSVVRLSLASNNLSTESFPMDFSCLSMLKDLCLDGNPIVSLPNCVRTLPRIETLSMNNCLMLTSVEYPPHTLTQLNLHCSYWKPGYKVSLQKILFNLEMVPLKLMADRNVLAPSSFEVEGMIKIQPMAGVEEKLLRSLGWPNLKFIKDSCMVTSYNYGGQEESQVQMYYEFGIFSTIFQENHWVPRQHGEIYFQTSISFTIPLTFNYKLRGLNLRIVGEFIELPKIRISNTTKNLTWVYIHYIRSVNPGRGYLMFLSHWMFGMNEMEVGDEISITLEKCNPRLIHHSCVHLIYDGVDDMTQRMKLKFDDEEEEDDDEDEEEEDPLDYYKSWNHIIGGDLSPFQLTTGHYFLNSMDFLRNLYSSDSNAHYKEKVVSFRAFSQMRSDMFDGLPPEPSRYRRARQRRAVCTAIPSRIIFSKHPTSVRILKLFELRQALIVDEDMNHQGAVAKFQWGVGI